MTKQLKNKGISMGRDVGGWSGKNHSFCILSSENEKI
jgi:hypothetical protein